MKRDIWGHRPGEDDDSPQGALERVVLAMLAEQRRGRRWKLFFRLVYLALAMFLIASLLPKRLESGGLGQDFTAVIDVDGVIADHADASADHIIAGLDEAFSEPHCKAVILKIDSPGGSPVQADQVYREIRRLRREHPQRKVYAVIGDMGASGAYYIAAAADEIYVSPASIVGSIGVIMESFGFPDALHKLGIERRVLTAGTHKAIGDPFSAQKPDEQAYLQKVLGQVHQQFIAAVREGRGQRLHVDADTFSGLFWTGDQAVSLGLADGFGSAADVARQIVHAPELVNFTHTGNPFDQAAKKIGLSAAEGLFQGLQTLAASPHLR